MYRPFVLPGVVAELESLSVAFIGCLAPSVAGSSVNAG